ncbi:carboxymethylenebutenolidase homolog isoform X2 [Elgaria multicarinata webbii]
MADAVNPCPCDIGDKFEYEGLGHEISVEHIKAYISMPSFSSDKAVIVIHDIHGWQIPNIRFITDLLASNGYIAICPDFFKSQEPWKPSNSESMFKDWLKSRDPNNINKETDVVLTYLKQQCNATKISAIGFCWGGAAVHHLMLTYPEFKAGVSLCGVIILMEDNYNLMNPTFFIFGENDIIIPLCQVTELEQKLKQQCKADFEVKIYPGQTHGFVHRKREDTNPKDKPYIEEARKDMLNWLSRYM